MLGCLLLLAAGPILTDDLWWHLAMGRAYAAGGPWLAADPLLHTAHASGPVQHEWLFGVLAHGIEQLVVSRGCGSRTRSPCSASQPSPTR